MSSVEIRLEKIRKSLGLSQREMASRLRLGANAWSLWENGTTKPRKRNLNKLKELGFNPDWILTGTGSMHLDDDGVFEAGEEVGALFEPYEEVRKSVSNKGLSEAQKPLKEADTDLLSRVFETVSNVYKELNIRVPIRVLGELAGQKHNEIIAASTDSAEWPSMIKLMALQLKKELQSTPAEGYRSNQNKDTA